MTYEEIAKELGISSARVRAIYQAAIRKLRSPKIGKKLQEYKEDR